jgi:hypothetical protein
MLAIPDERVNLCIGVCEVGALRVGTGETLGIDAFGGTSPAFDLAKGGVPEQVLVLHLTREWRPVGRRGNRPGSGA